jgi:sugar phosphate isomerase/epimerase
MAATGISRRKMLLASLGGIGTAAGAASLGTTMGLATTSFMTAAKPKDALEFLEYSHSLGAGGIQASLRTAESEYARRLRGRAGELGMYVEVMAGLPKGDTVEFERVVVAAKEAGALCIRTACLGGRRYETFSSLDEWKRFVADSHARIRAALSIAEKHRIAVALENHKDWTAEELVGLVRQYQSEYLGVCLDTGNNIALLDAPLETVDRLAPYAISTHLKDAALEEDDDGFLLADVPLGEGILDLEAMVARIRAARPATRFSLEMITRNPLHVPCLTETYWATFPERNGSYLARTLALVRARKPATPLPRVDQLDAAALRALEEENVKKCIAYARDKLGLRAG